MRKGLMFALGLLAICVCGTFSASQARADAGPLRPNATVDEVLDALQADGKTVQSFTADVKDDEENQIQGGEIIRFGKVWFDSPPGGEAVLHLLLDHKQVGKKQYPEKKEYLVKDGWAVDREFGQTNEKRIQLVPAGQKVNPFQLRSGQLPLPIGQDKNDVLGKFDVSLQPLGKDDPAKSIHLVLKPKAGTQLAREFLYIEVWVDCASRMPVQMLTEDKGQTELKTWDLLNLKVNPNIAPADLTLPPLPEGWKTIDVPLKP
jgi:outer membrane lipoprotein-sorting protein